MKAVSLFAGVGGMDLACEAAGIDVIATAEINQHAHALLKKKWPERHHYTDVKEVTRERLLGDTGALPDLLIGGFPCQDLSSAGAGAGLAGARSGLFWEIIRIARECETKWLLLENVPGLLSKRHVRDMGTVLGALSDSGYGWAYRCLDAQYFGVPQRRRRVFFVGHLGGDGSAPSEVLALAEGRSGNPAPSRTQGTVTPGTAEHGADDSGVVSTLMGGGKRGYRVGAEEAAGGQLIVTAVAGSITHTLTSEGADASEDGTGRGTPIVTYRKSKRAQTDQDDETWVTNTLNLFDQGDTRATSLIVEAPPLAFMWQAGGNNSAATAHSSDVTPTLPRKQTIAVHAGTVVRRLTPLECERLQGFPDNWTAGQADTHRYRQMGNAVAVPCVSWILQRLVLAAAGAVGRPRHDAIVHQLLEGVPQVGAEVAVALLSGDLPGGDPEVIGDADVA